MIAKQLIRLGQQFFCTSTSPEPTESVGTELLCGLLAKADAQVLQLGYELALHSGLPHQAALTRCLPLLFQHCAIHLADDLADGDCDYLEAPQQQGTTALYSLQQAYCQHLLALPLSTPTMAAIQSDLLAVGLAQHQELATQHWDLQNAQTMAEGLNGRQFRAYFRICSDEQQNENMAQLGYAFGVSNHLANDIRSRDVRFWSLSGQEQAQIKAWGRVYLAQICDSPVTLLRQQSQQFMRYLG